MAYRHDKLGRVRSKAQVTSFATAAAATNRVAHVLSFDYDLADNLTTATLPSGRTITYGRDAIGRVQWISGMMNAVPRTYLTVPLYTAWSRPWVISYGNGTTESRLYDARGWLSRISSGELSLDYTWYANGNLEKQQITAPNSITPSLVVTQSYNYYRPGQINSATERVTPANQPPGAQRWIETFNYDGYGNRTIVEPTSFPLHGNQPTAFNGNTNAVLGTYWNYDRAGYMVNDGVETGGAGTEHEYDGEGRLRRYNKEGNAVLYSYDGEGRRVMKYENNGSRRTIYVYDAEGELAAEYRTDAADPVCTADGPGCTQFLMADHLGSTRVVTSRLGGVLARYDYLPYGGEVPGYLRTELGSEYGADLRMPVKFTGQMRDGESGLDYFGARYYSAAQGRFLSPDPENAGAVMEMPQSWHGYAYVMNNPMAYVDPSGLGPCPVREDGTEEPCLEELEYSQWQRRFFEEMRRRTDASNQMIIGVGGGSAAVGVLGGFATATGTAAVVINGVSYTYAQLAALGPEVIAGLVASGKLSKEVFQRLAAQSPVLVNQVYLRLFAQGNHKTIAQGWLNNNNYFRIGEGFYLTLVFRISIGSKHAPLPSWIPGVVNGTFHINLWKGHWRM